MYSDWTEAGLAANKQIDLSNWTNAEIAAAMKAHKMVVSESFATVEEIAKVNVRTCELSMLIIEYKSRISTMKSLNGVQQIFSRNGMLRVAPGELNIVVKGEATPVSAYGVGYFAEKQEEAISYAAAGAVVARTYGHKGHIIATSQAAMPAIVREEYLKSHNEVLKTMAEILVNTPEAFAQRDKMAQFFLSKGGFLPVCALFSNMEVKPFVPCQKAPEKVLALYEKHGIGGKTMYAVCSPPKYTESDKATAAMAIFFRNASRKIRGEDNKQITSLCAPSYIGEFPRTLQQSLTTAFALMMVARMVSGEERRLLDFKGYKMSSEVQKFISSYYAVRDDSADVPFKGDGVGFYYYDIQTDPSNVIEFIRDTAAESTVSKTNVRDPQDVSQHIDSLVARMGRSKHLLLVDCFAYTHLFGRKDLTILPHPIGHRCRVFIALNNRLEMAPISEMKVANYFNFCNMWRTYYPYHRQPMWVKGLMFYSSPPPIIITREIKHIEPNLFDVGIVADDFDERAYDEMLRAVPEKPRVVDSIMQVQVVKKSPTELQQFAEVRQDDVNNNSNTKGESPMDFNQVMGDFYHDDE